MVTSMPFFLFMNQSGISRQIKCLDGGEEDELAAADQLLVVIMPVHGGRRMGGCIKD